MRSGLAALDPADVQRGRLPVDLRPFQIAQLLCSKSMPISDQHEGGIALALGVRLAALPGGLDELLDLVGYQVFALAQVGVDRSDWHCPVLCVGATSRSLAFACILLPPMELIYLIM